MRKRKLFKITVTRYGRIDGTTQQDTDNLNYFSTTQIKIKAKGILRLSRGYLTTFIRATTGHNFLCKHQNHIDPYISAVYRFCEEEVETIFHFMVECPKLRELQRDIFLDKQHTDDNSWSINKVKTFILAPIIYHTLMSKAGLSEIEKEPHEVRLPSDTDSSL